MLRCQRRLRLVGCAGGQHQAALFAEPIEVLLHVLAHWLDDLSHKGHEILYHFVVTGKAKPYVWTTRIKLSPKRRKKR